MQDLINEIMTKAIEISKNTKSTIFVDYAGHVNWLEVRIFVNGWEENKDYDINIRAELGKEDAIEDLKHILEELKKLG